MVLNKNIFNIFLTFKVNFIYKQKNNLKILLYKSINNKIKLKGPLLCCFLLLSITLLYGQKKNDQNYTRLIDSANYYVGNSLNKAQTFLDAIPKPLEEHIKGRLADYYSTQALIQSDKGEYPKMYQSYVSAVNYAEKEKNYRVGGMACIELFSNIYFVKKDTTAYKYLEKAKEFYTHDKYEHGLVEIEQMYAYVKYLDHEYRKSNDLILPHLEKYKNIKDDAYYYMFAIYMLTENYIKLEDFNIAHSSFKEFQTIKNNTTIVKYNYLSFEAGIYLSFAEVYLSKKQLDSASNYIDKATELRKYMSNDLVREYLGLRADAYKFSGHINEAKIYLDSLSILEKKMFNNIVDASFQLNEPLFEAKSQLQSESDEKFKFAMLSVVLLCILLVFTVFYFIYYKRQKFKLNDFKDIASNFSYLKFTNEKLTGKVRGLEDYISSIKKDIKQVSKIHDISLQRERIKELYTSLHINSSTLLDKSESHLELVNDLNVDFFNQIHLKYPELNDSEVITCYYLFMGFKNKEIAMFLNTSIRALESKRYRISKKIEYDYKKETTTLLRHLKETFKSTQVE